MRRLGSTAQWIGTTMLAMSLIASCSRAAPSTAPGEAPPASSDLRVLDDCPELPCQGALEPGPYRWTFSDPDIAFTIGSPGWTWYYSGGFRIVAGDFASVEGLDIPEGVYFLHDPAIASQDCEESPEPGVGRSVEDLTAWLETAPGLEVSDATPVTVDGLDGVQMDIELDRAWKEPCFFTEDIPTVPLIFSGAELGGYHVSMLPDRSLRWYILETDDGVLIIDVEDGRGGLPTEELFRTGDAIVDSLEFTW